MITGIEILKFGVEDRAASNKFLADFGLSKSTSDIEGADLYQTQNGSKIYLFNCDDNRLPPAIEQGSTLREVTWGGLCCTNRRKVELSNLQIFMQQPPF